MYHMHEVQTRGFIACVKPYSRYLRRAHIWKSAPPDMYRTPVVERPSPLLGPPGDPHRPSLVNGLMRTLSASAANNRDGLDGTRPI